MTKAAQTAGREPDWGHCKTCGAEGHPHDDLRGDDAKCKSCKAERVKRRAASEARND